MNIRKHSIFTMHSYTKRPIGILTFLFVCVFHIISPVYLLASAIDVNSQSEQILTDMEKVDPAIPQKVDLSLLNSNNYKSKQKELEINVNTLKKNITIQKKNQKDTAIGIPNPKRTKVTRVKDNKVIYFNDNSTQTIVEPVDGGIRQIIRINNASAPKFYDFPVDLKEGEVLKLTDGGVNISNNESKPIGAVIQNKDGSTKLTVAPPWAKDKNGQDLKTYYTVEQGNILRQYVKFDNNTAFPIMADPIWCGNSIDRTSWEFRPGNEGGWTLMVRPTWCGRMVSGMDFYELIAKTERREDLWPDRNRNYTTTQGRSMYNQYRCHVVFASMKSSYNLEPWRPMVEWRVMISRNFPYSCNP